MAADHPRICVGQWGDEQSLGGVVVAAVWLDELGASSVGALGVPDPVSLAPGDASSWSRRLRMMVPVEVVKVGPGKYNALWNRYRSRDRILNFCYVTSIRGLAERYPTTRTVVHGVESVAFAVLPTDLHHRGDIDLVYRGPRAADRGTRAASVIARSAYERSLREMTAQLDLPRPVHELDEETLAGLLLDRWGRAGLSRVFKRDTPIVWRTLEQAPGRDGSRRGT